VILPTSCIADVYSIIHFDLHKGLIKALRTVFKWNKELLVSLLCAHFMLSEENINIIECR